MGNLASSVSLDTDANASSLPQSSRSSSTVALIAVSHYMTLTKAQVLELRGNCMVGSLGQKRNRPKVSRGSFHKAMVRTRIIDTEHDWDIIEQLFTMWDDEGDDRVDYLEFLAGISPLASCRETKTLKDVLLFALQVMDARSTARISQEKLEKILLGINFTAGFFGDKVLSSQQVHVLTDSVFLSLEPNSVGEITHEDCTEMLSSHPMVEQFVYGLGLYTYIPSEHRLLKEEIPYVVRDSNDGGAVVSSDPFGNKNQRNVSTPDEDNEI